MGLILVPAVLCVAVAWLFQRRLIYLPFDQSVRSVASLHPGAEDVVFRTEDGLQLGGWFIPAAAGGSSTILVFNGNAGNREYRMPLARGLAARGHSVLLFDYRGYGGNPGNPSEAGLIRDARAAVAHLESRLDADPSKIIYFGESLGAAVAVALAAERPPAALILRSPFTSMVEVGQAHYPFLPVGSLLRDRYPSVERIERIDVPLLVIAGENDRVVPHDQSRRLFDRAPTSDKQFVSVAGADHNDAALTAGEAMMDTIGRFVTEITSREGS